MSKEEVLEKKVAEEEKEKIKDTEVEHKENKEEKNVDKTRKSKKSVIISGIIIVVIAILIIIIGALFISSSYSKNIAYGVKINDIDVSNMSIDEAKDVLNNSLQEKINRNIVLFNNEYEVNTTLLQAGLIFDVDEAVQNAYNVGRDGNVFSNNFTILNTRLNGNNINLNNSIDENKFLKLVEEINDSIQNGIEQPNYYINEAELIIIAGKEGNAVNEEKLKELIYNQLNNQENNGEKIEIPVKMATPNKIDIDSIYNEIHKDAKDAYVTKEPFEVHPHVDGVDFAVSIEEAKNILQEEKEEYKISLKIIKPSITTDSLGDEAFPDMLATYSTKYSTAESNRSTNIMISVNKINGVVLMPGEEFSYNKILGPRTPQAGYKLGAAYIGGKVVSDYGGGVCQTSSTLYNAVLLSNLEVISRTSHYFAASYVPIGRDATVYWPSLDFKFKNNRNYPIKIRASAVNGTIKIDILGLKEESDYEVELDSYVTGYIPFKTEYKNDNTLAQGKEVVEQAGSNGTRSETYKILKKDGKVISRTLVSRDTYSGKTKIVRRGTKKEVQKPKEENINSNNNKQQENNKQQNTESNNVN